MRKYVEHVQLTNFNANPVNAFQSIICAMELKVNPSIEFQWKNSSITFNRTYSKCLECQDASDETVDNCASKCCPPFGFRCGYGACVDNEARCDGKFDCKILFPPNAQLQKKYIKI